MLSKLCHNQNESACPAHEYAFAEFLFCSCIYLRGCKRFFSSAAYARRCCREKASPDNNGRCGCLVHNSDDFPDLSPELGQHQPAATTKGKNKGNEERIMIFIHLFIYFIGGGGLSLIHI